MLREMAGKVCSMQQKSGMIQKMPKIPNGDVEREESGDGEDMKGRTEGEGRQPEKR
jgi:hypothetical protein